MKHTPVMRSAAVVSNQQQPHQRLAGLVRRHQQHAWKGGHHQASLQAFAELQALVAPAERDALILDSGCGTGESTRHIAAAFPRHLVIGIDQSAARLGRLKAAGFPHREDNMIWLRAELASLWRAMHQAGWRLRRHYLLYPNPWPKSAQLQRRWHGHPVFPHLLALGGRLELRSNWRIYAEEFALATRMVLGEGTGPPRADSAVTLSTVADGAITSPFERKYRASGHRLYCVVAQLDSVA